ncbi:MAG: hypothetical protein KIS62_19920 [Ramlibacter sp.]|nr:hypothetical protein [Ramlibacter sp.]
MPQPLNYLLFDTTDEESGACAFDAMASVTPDRLPALLAEVQAVLAWATHLFGPPSGAGDECDTDDWAFDLEATDLAGAPLAITWDMQSAQVLLPADVKGRLTLTLTISGHRAFAEAFGQAFADAL